MKDVKYTQVAAKAVSLAELFEARFDQELDGPTRFRIVLAAPDGPSTAGGKQALQHIKLMPEGGGRTIVIGSASTIKQTAEIRTFEHVAELHAQRFKGARIPIDVARYRTLTQELATFFTGMKITTVFMDIEGPPRSTLDRPRSAAGVWGIVAALLGVAILATLAVFLYRR